MNLRVDFDVTTDPSTDQVLAQMRSAQATAQLPPQVQEVGVTMQEVRVEPPRAVHALLAQGHATTSSSSATTPTSTSTTR